MSEPARVLVTGATGFVGRHVLPALRAAGYATRCASRDPARAELADPEGEWVRLDVDEPGTLSAGLAGCDAALFLVHGMSEGPDYPERELRAAVAFRLAAEEAGVRRVVYLGGVAPPGTTSRHLESRRAVGAALAGGRLDVVELRAAMIVGLGSASWRIVRDLVRRLPFMLLPSWLGNHSWPIGVDDVVAGLLLALRAEVPAGIYDLPGPERLSHRALLQRAARRMGRSPFMFGVPVVTPRLSTYWIRLVTSAERNLVRELVEGLRTDLDPGPRTLWAAARDHAPGPIDEAIDHALAAEERNEQPDEAARARLQALGARLGPAARGQAETASPGPARAR